MVRLFQGLDQCFQLYSNHTAALGWSPDFLTQVGGDDVFCGAVLVVDARTLLHVMSPRLRWLFVKGLWSGRANQTREHFFWENETVCSTFGPEPVPKYYRIRLRVWAGCFWSTTDGMVLRRYKEGTYCCMVASFMNKEEASSGPDHNFKKREEMLG